MSRIYLTRAQLETARKKIRKHYSLNRKVTDQEVHAEVANLQRKNGDFCDLSRRLHSMLVNGAHPVHLD